MGILMQLADLIFRFDWLGLPNVLVVARLYTRLSPSYFILLYLLICVCWAQTVPSS